MIASVSSAGATGGARVRLRASLHEPGRDLGPRHQAVAAAHLDDLERPALPVERAPRARRTSSRACARGRKVEHLLDALGLDRSVGGEEQGFDHVDGLGHAAVSCGPPGSRVAVGLRSQGRLARPCRLADVPLDDDLAEELGLLGARLPEPHQLEQGQQRHDPLGADALVPGHGREEDGPRVRARARGSRPCARAPRAGSARSGAARCRFCSSMSRVIARWRRCTERSSSGTSSGGGSSLDGAAVQQRLLGLALAEPGAERLDARVLAQPLRQLLAQELALLVERVRRRLGIGRQQELGLEVDQGGGHDHEGAGGLEVLELHRLEVGQVLLGDRAHGQVGEVDLAGAAEVEQQVERARRSDSTRTVRPCGSASWLSGRVMLAHGSRLITARGPRPWSSVANSRACLRALVEDLHDLARLRREALAPLPDPGQRRQHVREQHRPCSRGSRCPPCGSRSRRPRAAPRG